MGSFKGDPGSEPRLVTPGQETVTRRGDFGFQASFVGLDWLEMSFQPERGDAEPWEPSSQDGLLHHNGALAIAPENRGDQLPFSQQVMSSQYTTLMIDRERIAREKTQLAVSIAVGFDLGDWTDVDGGIGGYKRHLRAPEGARIDYDRTGSGVAGDGFYFHVTLPGKVARMMSEEAARKLMQFCLDHNGKGTRIDLAIDDYERVISIDDIEETTKTEDFVSRTQRVLSMRSHAPRSSEITGQTLYIGKPSSRRILRIYDKWLESGEKDCIRWELEEHKTAAETLMLQLTERDPITNKPKPWAQVARERLTAFVDFRDADSHSEVEKRERLAWFEALVENVGAAKIYPAEIPKTLDQVLEWVEQQIGPTLRVIVLAAGGSIDDLTGMIHRARERMKPRHLALIAGACAKPDCDF